MSPTREEVAEVYVRLKSITKTAEHFRVKRHKMVELIGKLNLGKRIRAENAELNGVPFFQKGMRLVWKPVTGRTGFQGAPEAREPWPVEVVKGPNGTGFYDVIYVGEDHRRRTSRAVFKVNGLRLHKEDR